MSRVVFLVLPGVQVVDLAGPVQVFHQANLDGAGYETEFVGVSGEAESAQGLFLSRLGELDAVAPGKADTVFVPGTDESRLAPGDLAYLGEAALPWLRRAHEAGARLCAVCTGAFVLAEAGLLDDRCCTTHWACLETFRARYPRVGMVGASIFTRSGSIYTSAGVATEIDLALSLVEEDHGPLVASQVARALVVYLRRSGNRANSGAGIFNQDSSSLVANCEFLRNVAHDGVFVGSGGGITNNGSVTITHSIFAGNVAKIGGGINNNANAPAKITNSVFQGNTADDGGAIRNIASPLTIANCTFVDNNALSRGGAIYNLVGNAPTITNSILWSNRAALGSEIANSQGSALIIRYSDIEGGWNGPGVLNEDGAVIQDGGGNILADAKFGADLHLQSGSPARNTADPASAPPEFPDKDIDGEDRPQEGRYDMGADEFYDSDSDGIPDYWELKWFNNLAQSSQSDWDGDGVADLLEFELGTDPTDRLDSFRSVQGSRANYRNRWFVSDPVGPEEEAVATVFFGGNICGAITDPPTLPQSCAPTDGSVYLVTSSFGQPFSPTIPFSTAPNCPAGETCDASGDALLRAAELLYWTEADDALDDKEATYTYARDKAAFRYRDLLYANIEGQGAVNQIEARLRSMSDFYGTDERGRVQNAEHFLRNALKYAPTDTTLRNALLDLHYDRAVAEQYFAKEKLVTVARLRLDPPPPGGFVIDNEIAEYEAILGETPGRPAVIASRSQHI